MRNNIVISYFLGCGSIDLLSGNSEEITMAVEQEVNNE
jgi:hypothetical protein